MREDAASKVQRYRQAANKYGELAKHAEPDYLAAVFRKVAVRYVFMAEDALRKAGRRREAGLESDGIALSASLLTNVLRRPRREK
jgi:hypothetical protein